MTSTLPLLSLLETRVLGVLVEKERTVADTYPLSLNSLTSGCNQKTNREPVIEASEAEVQAAVDALKAHEESFEVGLTLFRRVNPIPPLKASIVNRARPFRDPER